MDIQNKMKKLAEKTELEFDGGENETRLFWPLDINVFVNLMNRKKYQKMEKQIKNTKKIGIGYEIYAWNDCGSYEYWKERGEEYDANYIMITVHIDPNMIDKIDTKKLMSDMKEIRNELSVWDNTNDYMLWRSKNEKGM